MWATRHLFQAIQHSRGSGAAAQYLHKFPDIRLPCPFEKGINSQANPNGKSVK